MMKKILLVDDHSLTRLLTSQTLTQQDANYEILEASNGQEACETEAHGRGSLVLIWPAAFLAYLLLSV